MESAVLVGLNPELFQTAFPFFIALDEALTILAIGKQLQILEPKIKRGEYLFEHFLLREPDIGKVDFSELLSYTNQRLVLELESRKIQFKGQLVHDKTRKILIFLITPWLQKIQELDRFSLKPTQFALHDLSLELLRIYDNEKHALEHAISYADENLKHRDRFLEGAANASSHLLAEESTHDAIQCFLGEMGRTSQAHTLSIHCAYQQLHLKAEDCIWCSNTHLKQFDTVTMLELWAKWQRYFVDKRPVIKTFSEMDEDEKFLFEKRNTRTFISVPILLGRVFYGFLLFEFSDEEHIDAWESQLLLSFAGAIGGFFSRKNTEEALQLSEARFRKIFDTSQEAILAIGEQSEVTMLNPAAEKMFGYSQKEGLGRPIVDFFKPDDRASVKHAIFARFSHGISKEDHEILSLTALRKNGTELPVEMSISPTEQLGESFVVSVIRDISERKKAEEAIKQARKYEEEIGYRIQKALLLGKLPTDMQGIDVAAHTIPSHGIDGDFYDFFMPGADYFDLVVGDVMGKGIPAALLGAATKAAFNRAITVLTLSLNGKRKPYPEEIVRLVHSQVTDQMIDLGSFMTVCYARFDIRLNQLTFVDCGHNLLLHYKSVTKECVAIQGGNVPLGFSENEDYRQHQVLFEENDLFFFYSDGITEAKNSVGEMFGVSRLKELLMKSPGKAANQVVNEVIENVKTFSGRDQLDDDLTAVAVRVAFPGTPLKAAESLMLPSSLDQLHYMREALSRFCEKARRFGWIDGDTIELSLAVNEVMTNIIRHAHGENASEKLLIHFSLFEDRIDINVEYHGKTFTPPTDITPSLDGSKDGGFGLYIINKMVDDVLYADGESGRRRVFLTKYIKNLRSQKLL